MIPTIRPLYVHLGPLAAAVAVFALTVNAERGAVILTAQSVAASVVADASAVWSSETATPGITATMVDTLIEDVIDGDADAGDTLGYQTVVENSGSSKAHDVLFSVALDENTTLIPGSISSTPVARNDDYASLGNVGISVPAGSGLLVNDSDPDGTGLGTPPIAFFEPTSSAGGSVSVNTATGAFTYDPDVGYRGVDSFRYAVDDGEGNTDTATVTIDVSDLIWFIDNSHGGTNNGSLANPFQSIQAFNLSIVPTSGDGIYIEHTGADYTNALTMATNQRVAGEGASQANLAEALGFTLPPHSLPLPTIGGTRPVLTNAAGNGINLSSGNTVRGLSIGNTSGIGIAGGSVGTLAIEETDIGGTGEIVDLTSGTVDVTFSSLSTTSSSNEGIDLEGLGGSFSVTGATTISGVTGNDIDLDNISGTVNIPSGSVTSSAGIALKANGGAGPITFGGSINNSAGTSVQSSFRSGGTLNLTGPISDSGSGIFLASNSGTTTFSGMLTLTTGASTAFTASSGGTVQATGAGSTISTTTGTAVNFLNTTIGASNITFESISVSGASNGIVLNNTGSTGSFNVTGDGSDGSLGGNASGGTLNNTTGNGIDLNGVGGGFHITSMNIVSPAGDGIEITELGGSSSIQHTTISDIDVSGTSAIHILNTGTSLDDLLVSRSVFTDALSGQSMFLVEGGGVGHTIQVRVDSSEFSNLDPAAYQHTAGLAPGNTSTVRTFFTNNSVINGKVASIGTSEVTLFKSHSANSEFVVEDNVFNAVGKFGVLNGILNVGGSAAIAGGDITGIIKGNDFSDLPGKARAVNVFVEPASGSATSIDVTIDGNRFDDLLDPLNDASAIHVEMKNGAGPSDIRIINNLIGTGVLPGSSPNQIGGTRDGIFVEVDDAVSSTMDLLFENNTVQVSNDGTGRTGDQILQVTADDNLTRINATIRGNAFNNAASSGISGTGDVAIYSDVSGSAVCLDLNSDNTNGNSGNQDFVIIRDPGATFETDGTSGTDGTIETFFGARNTITIDAQGDGGGGFANASCPTPPAIPTIVPNLPEDVDLVFEPGLILDNPTSVIELQETQSVAKSEAYTTTGSQAITSLADVDVQLDSLDPGQTVIVTFLTEVTPSSSASQICQQGSVTGSNFAAESTDDPDEGGGADPTCIALDELGLPVELTAYTGTVVGYDAHLAWATASEASNAGFEVQSTCLSCQSGEPVEGAAEWRVLGFVEGHGTTAEPRDYLYIAKDLDVGTHAFRLKQIDFDGAFEFSPVIELAVEIPGRFILEPAYPNPFNPSANIRFGVVVAQPASVRLYDMHGRLIRTLFEGTAPAGELTTAIVDGSGLASGSYLVRLETADFAASQRIMLLK